MPHGILYAAWREAAINHSPILMLRFVIALLIAANVLYFLWTLGAFGFLGQAPRSVQHEPQRLEKQVRPESIEILSTTTEPAAP